MFVLYRAGKIDLIGPFDTFESAGKFLIEKSLLGYQILPLKDPFPSLADRMMEQADVSVAQQVEQVAGYLRREARKFSPDLDEEAEKFLAWATTYSASKWGNTRDEQIGYFLSSAEAKFPVLFVLQCGCLPRKIKLIVGLRCAMGGRDAMELAEAKEAVDDYEIILQGEEQVTDQPKRLVLHIKPTRQITGRDFLLFAEAMKQHKVEEGSPVQVAIERDGSLNFYVPVPVKEQPKRTRHQTAVEKQLASRQEAISKGEEVPGYVPPVKKQRVVKIPNQQKRRTVKISRKRLKKDGGNE